MSIVYVINSIIYENCSLTHRNMTIDSNRAKPKMMKIFIKRLLHIAKYTKYTAR